MVRPRRSHPPRSVLGLSAGVRRAAGTAGGVVRRASSNPTTEPALSKNTRRATAPEGHGDVDIGLQHRYSAGRADPDEDPHRGIGLELVRQLAQRGWIVILGARDPTGRRRSGTPERGRHPRTGLVLADRGDRRRERHSGSRIEPATNSATSMRSSTMPVSTTKPTSARLMPTSNGSVVIWRSTFSAHGE